MVSSTANGKTRQRILFHLFSISSFPLSPYFLFLIFALFLFFFSLVLFFPRSVSSVHHHSLAPWRVPHWRACVSALVLSWRGKKQGKERNESQAGAKRDGARERERVRLTAGNEGKNLGENLGKYLKKPIQFGKNECVVSSFVHTRVQTTKQRVAYRQNKTERGIKEIKRERTKALCRA